ncbi:response regulator [Magnetococcus sp. PR-3]|uniref:response regulator n=1 Tax=Magnetococcus sp. PR-3 TaxID=3120355 RepID=UPI002FCDF70E
MRTILIAEDDATSAFHLETFLTSEGYKVLMAENGQQAVDLYQEKKPDLVIMDILMPILNGYKATQQIRASIGKDEIDPPILFLTSVESDEELAHCLACGGDDFVLKPFNPIILKARLRSLLNRLVLAEEKQHALNQIAAVLHKLRESAHFEPKQLHFVQQPISRVSGDVVLSATKPNGNRLIGIGDFTGHDLPAAICGPLVIPKFYEMTAQGVATETIFNSINKNLYDKLPQGFFMAASFMEFNPVSYEVSLWNFAAPGIFSHQDGEWVCHQLHQLPLGALENLHLPMTSATFQSKPGDRLYAYSDGLNDTLEVLMESGEYDLLTQFFQDMDASDSPTEQIKNPTEGAQKVLDMAKDDITVVSLMIP